MGSTTCRDNDRSSLNCASMLKGGWWWRSCGRGLNGLYLTDPNDVIARQGEPFERGAARGDRVVVNASGHSWLLRMHVCMY